ncbi:EamA family transporter [Rhodanobacter sp. Col0626]|uniref:EamA family transporter n=1 Tax=Rhodanobacter sp. Col0626 TaxID=3415679 RepID=UPI003CEF7FDC
MNKQSTTSPIPRFAPPPQLYFVASAIFHYLGPAFAVLLFARVEPLGVAWLRIASAALIFAVWRRPWRHFLRMNAEARWNVVGLGVVLGGMNACFYLAIDHLPLATVGAIEFLGPIALALAGLRTQRNVVALALVVAGVWFLTHLRLAGAPLGFVFAFANCALFTLYIVLGHRVANDGGGSAIDRLAAAMLVALAVVTLIGIRPAVPAMLSLPLLAAGIGVGVTSSVIPYVCDQLAMARLPRATFAMLLALLPATACVVGAVVLHQLPGRTEMTGIALVAAGIAIHREARR